MIDNYIETQHLSEKYSPKAALTGLGNTEEEGDVRYENVKCNHIPQCWMIYDGNKWLKDEKKTSYYFGRLAVPNICVKHEPGDDIRKQNFTISSQIKYNIEGFSQLALIEKGLDCRDAVFLRWFIDFQETGKMRNIESSGKRHFWLKHQAIIDTLPILGFSKANYVRKYIDRLVSKGVLHKTVVRRGKGRGTNTFYNIDQEILTTLLYHRHEKSVKNNQRYEHAGENDDQCYGRACIEQYETTGEIPLLNKSPNIHSSITENTDGFSSKNELPVDIKESFTLWSIAYEIIPSLTQSKKLMVMLEALKSKKDASNFVLWLAEKARAEGNDPARLFSYLLTQRTEQYKDFKSAQESRKADQDKKASAAGQKATAIEEVIDEIRDEGYSLETINKCRIKLDTMNISSYHIGLVWDILKADKRHFDLEAQLNDPFYTVKQVLNLSRSRKPHEYERI